MDPKACFERIVAELRCQATDEAYDAAEDLFRWLYKGGFAPSVPEGTYIMVGDGGETAYSIRSLPNDFVRYTIHGNHAGNDKTRDYPAAGGQRS